MSLIELLIGIALGLFIVASGLALLSSHLHENRALVLEARLMQDLRSASDFIVRELRRAGHWGEAGAGLWQPHRSPRSNPYQSLRPDTAISDTVQLTYSRDQTENHQVDHPEVTGFRLRNQTIEIQLGADNWQALTDPATVNLRMLRLTPHSSVVALPGLCPRPCPPPAPGALDCPPRVLVRHLELQISGRSPFDARLERSLLTRVRVRNDALVGACPP